jgi:hypothetical protein
MDWTKIVNLLLSNPDLIVALAILIGLVAGMIGGTFWFAWWLRSHIGKERVATLNTRIAGLQDTNKGLQDTNNLRVEGLKTELDGLLRQINDGKEVIKKLEAKNDTHVSTIGLLQEKLLKNTITLAELNVQLRLLGIGTSQMAGDISALSQANTAIGATLHTITGRLEVAEASDTLTATDTTDADVVRLPITLP